MTSEEIEAERQLRLKEREAALGAAKKAEAELRLLFAIMDAAGDGDGVLTLAELQSALRK